MKKFTLLMSVLLCALVSNAKVYDVRVKKMDYNVAFDLTIHVAMYIEDEGLERALAKEMFHHDGDIKTAAEAYLKQFATAKRDDVARRKIEIVARPIYDDVEKGIVCMTYVSAGKEHIADVSETKHLTYDMKAGKVVSMSDIVTPALCDYLKQQGIDASNVTDLKTISYSYSARAGKNDINITPYKLYKQMTDYGLSLVGMTREKIEKQVAEGTDLSKVYDVVETQPTFPGGPEALMKYLKENIKYPEVAQKYGVQGRVIVQFTVDSDGSIIDVTIYKGVDPLLDTEAVRVIRQMPVWQPGRNKDTAVRVRYTLPITFNLNK